MEEFKALKGKYQHFIQYSLIPSHGLCVRQ